MSEGPILDPLGASTEAEALASRIAALEARLGGAVAGVAIPALTYLPGTVDASWRSAITNGAAFGAGNDDPWVGVVPRWARSAVRCEVPWATDAATTGELKLTAVSGTLQAATISLPAGSSGTATWNWLHGRPLWAGAANLDLWARRSGGAGTVYVGYPRMWLIDPAGCTVTGV